MRFRNECTDILTCENCHNQFNENKEFEAILILLKREAPNQFSHMLPFFEECKERLRWHLFFWEWFNVRLKLKFFHWKGFFISINSSLKKE